MLIGIDRLTREKEKLITKIDSARQEIQKLSEGRTTLKNIFKSQTAKQNRISELHTFVSRSEVIVETYKNVIESLIIYLAMKEIPQFKLWKTSNYYKGLTTFCTEVSNPIFVIFIGI